LPSHDATRQHAIGSGHAMVPAAKRAAEPSNRHDPVMGHPLHQVMQQNPHGEAQRALVDVIAQSPRVALQRKHMAAIFGPSAPVGEAGPGPALQARRAIQMHGGVPINDDTSLEREADVMGARAMQGAARDNKTHLPHGSERRSQYGAVSQATVQRAQLNAQGAADQAEVQRNASPHNRAAKTNDWIADADEGATESAWAAKAISGYVFNKSVSHTGGGAGRPPSIDLKAKPTGAEEAEFIFHLPIFAGVQELIDYLLRASGITAKLAKIREATQIDLQTAGDFGITKIRDTETVDISPLTSHEIYERNATEILAINPTFITDLQDGPIATANADLARHRQNPVYLSKLTDMRARSAYPGYLKIFKLLSSRYPVNRLDSSARAGIFLYLGELRKLYASALPKLSEKEKSAHKTLVSRCNVYFSICILQEGIGPLLYELQSRDFTAQDWPEANNRYEKLQARYLKLNPYLEGSERDALGLRLAQLHRELLSKQPPIDDLKRLAPDRKPDDDTEPPGPTKRAKFAETAETSTAPQTTEGL
jgi:hypothetical protein